MDEMFHFGKETFQYDGTELIIKKHRAYLRHNLHFTPIDRYEIRFKNMRTKKSRHFFGDTQPDDPMLLLFILQDFQKALCYPYSNAPLTILRRSVIQRINNGEFDSVIDCSTMNELLEEVMDRYAKSSSKSMLQ